MSLGFLQVMGSHGRYEQELGDSWTGSIMGQGVMRRGWMPAGEPQAWGTGGLEGPGMGWTSGPLSADPFLGFVASPDYCHWQL